MDDFLNNLSEEQAQAALEVARKAKEMGIDPKLAVALAFRESSLNPNTKNGTSGEIGLMQVMPATAEMMGFSPEDLRDPAKNIEIGLTYLKQGLDKFGDPVLAAAGYNAGHNHPYFTDPENKSLPASTKEYLKGISSLGGFAASPEEAPPEPVETPASEEDFTANKARMTAGALGAGAGAAISKGLDVASNVGKTADAIRQMPGALAAAQAGSMQAPPATQAPQGPNMGRPVAGGPAGPAGGPVGGPARSMPPLQQMGGSGTANYGKAFGLTDIEANRALDMTKNPGGANDLINQRRQAMQKIQQMGGGFVENPNFGGIMTPEQTAGGGPRASFVQNPAAQGGLSQIPTPKPVSAAPPPPPPPPGPLSQAGGALKQGAGAVLRSPVAMGALGGLSTAASADDATKRMQEGDTTGAGIAATGGVGGLMQMMPNPKLRAIGTAISAASPLTNYLRDKLGNQPEGPDPTEEELLMAQQPYLNYRTPRGRPQISLP